MYRLAQQNAFDAETEAEAEAEAQTEGRFASCYMDGARENIAQQWRKN